MLFYNKIHFDYEIGIYLGSPLESGSGVRVVKNEEIITNESYFSKSILRKQNCECLTSHHWFGTAAFGMQSFSFFALVLIASIQFLKSHVHPLGMDRLLAWVFEF